MGKVMVIRCTIRFLVLCSLLLSMAACNEVRGPETIHRVAPITQYNSSSLGSQLHAINLPADGKVLFVMGQDTETLSAFRKEVLMRDPTFPVPGGVTLYTNISHNYKFGSLPSLTADVDWGAGNNNFLRTLKEFPGAALVVGLDITGGNGECKSITTNAIAGIVADGVSQDLIKHYRVEVDKLIQFLKDTNRPVFLRIGYEFDGPWNCYDASSYKKAYRYIKQRSVEMNAGKIATVWQSATWLRDKAPYIVTDENHLEKFYPGDDVVDWVGFSKFYNLHYKEHQWVCDELIPGELAPHVSPNSQHDRVLNFARAHKKPVMIAEAAPTAYSNSELTSSCISTNRPTPISAEAIWKSWYQEWFDHIEANKDIIRAVAYINADWHSQSMWHCEPKALVGSANCKQGYWGDSRIQANPIILEKFKQQLLKNTFVKP